MIPRSVAVRQRPPAQASPPPSGPSDEPLLTTSSTIPAAAAVASTSSAAIPTTEQEDDQQRLVEQDEIVLLTLEAVVSPWGLWWNTSSAVLEFRERLQASDGGVVHLSAVLGLPALKKAGAKSIVDLQRALQSRPSNRVALSDDQFSLRVLAFSEWDGKWDEFAARSQDEWEEMMLYLDEVPVPSSSSSTKAKNVDMHDLGNALSALFNTQIQHIVVPTLYSSEADYSSESSRPGFPPQAIGAGTSLRRVESSWRGFCFVVLGSAEDARRVTEVWKGVRQRSARSHKQKAPEGEGFKGEGFENSFEEGDSSDSDDDDDSDDESESDEAEEVAMATNGDASTAAAAAPPTPRKPAKIELSYHEQCLQSGLRALPFKNWQALKLEYLAYRTALKQLQEHNSHVYRNKHVSYPRGKTFDRDLPPHQQDSQNTSRQKEGGWGGRDDERPRAMAEGRWGKVNIEDGKAYDDPYEESRKRRHGERDRARDRDWKRPRNVDQETGGADSTALMYEEEIKDYPEGCVLWVKNIHERTNRTILRNIFEKLLDQAEEGSGKGVEFVDYEKGLDTCHVRMTSSHHSRLIVTLLRASLHFHISSAVVSTDTGGAGDEDLPLAVEVIKGERERLYWAVVPKDKRRQSGKKSRGEKA